MPAPEKTTAPGVARASATRAPDQLERRRPVEPHAALRGVHRFGDAETERPQVAAIRERRVPVDRRRSHGSTFAQRIGNDVRRGERDAVPSRLADGTGHEPAARIVYGAMPPASVGDRSRVGARSRRERRHVDPAPLAPALQPSSASWTPLAPSSRFHWKGPPSTTWRRNSSHSTLKALSYARLSGRPARYRRNRSSAECPDSIRVAVSPGATGSGTRSGPRPPSRACRRRGT